MTDFSWVFGATTPSTLLATIKALSTADIINGLYETFGGVFITLSIRKLHADKRVQGVSWVPTAFFASWGYWNLYFYPHLDQWFSFIGGVGIVTANTIWLCQMWYWLSHGKPAPKFCYTDDKWCRSLNGAARCRDCPVGNGQPTVVERIALDRPTGEGHLFDDPTLPKRREHRICPICHQDHAMLWPKPH